jgi:hypothetical protein
VVCQCQTWETQDIHNQVEFNTPTWETQDIHNQVEFNTPNMGHNYGQGYSTPQMPGFPDQSQYNSNQYPQNPSNQQFTNSPQYHPNTQYGQNQQFPPNFNQYPPQSSSNMQQNQFYPNTNIGSPGQHQFSQPNQIYVNNTQQVPYANL